MYEANKYSFHGDRDPAVHMCYIRAVQSGSTSRGPATITPVFFLAGHTLGSWFFPLPPVVCVPFAPSSLLKGPDSPHRIAYWISLIVGKLVLPDLLLQCCTSCQLLCETLGPPTAC